MNQPFHVPYGTYRLQFHRDFTFRDAQRLVPYLRDLGAGDCYCSPYLMARPGSRHGYDIIDHTRLNLEVGTEEDYNAFVTALHANGLGQILDFVPNHMGIDPCTNRWWRDVLENGPASMYGRFFDIDWNPVKPELRGKVLLPILGDQYGTVLESGDLRLGFASATLHVGYFEHNLPINPRHAASVYERNVQALRVELGEEDPDLREFLSVLTALKNLPEQCETDPERIAERHREKEVARERLARLVEHCARIRRHIEEAVRAYNGEPGRSDSFDLLHDLLEKQAYRLAYWRTAAHEINYRRFFDINHLAGIRMENPEVFAATHVLLARLIAEDAVQGMRIDHPDGLYDPAEYFRRVQAMAARARTSALSLSKGVPSDDVDAPARRLYVIGEKVLSAGESLPADWPISGTTGYNFCNELNGVFVDASNARALRRIYRRVTRQMATFDEVVYQCKKLITRTSLASEINVLAHALNQISEGNRRSRDFTLNSLRDVLGEVVACFPVYRSYVNERGWTQSDRAVIETAVRRARRRNPALEPSAWDFLREVLLPRPASDESRDEPDTGIERRVNYPPPDAEEYRKRLHFAMRFQQYTAPVQAKGVEDTAFYRYNLLLSLNEVGGDPGRVGRSAAEFHESNRARLEQRPLEMTSTATHDTKLGEDVRARINVISELVDDWRRGVVKWMRINAGNRTKLDTEPAPDRNDEYRFYQILVGTWPAEAFRAQAIEKIPPPDSVYVRRVRDYMIKAIKEAKLRTSWINDNQAYDDAVARFVERVLTGPTSRRFLAAFLPFAHRVAHLGMINSLSQLALKIASPGVPDFYQGTELWDLRLVDPDNREPVDYERRIQYLDDLRPWLGDDPDVGRAFRPAVARRFSAAEREPTPTLPDGGSPLHLAAVRDLLACWPDGRIKLLLMAIGLRLRRSYPDLFLHGDYVPLGTDMAGVAGDVISFARRFGGKTLLVAVPRLIAKLVNLELPVGGVWGEARLLLPPDLAGCYRNLLTAEEIETPAHQGAPTIRLSDALGHCPVACLLGVGTQLTDHRIV